MRLRAPVAAGLALALHIACSSTTPAATAPPPDPPLEPTATQQAEAERLLTGPDWYRHAIFYEVYVRSFQDSNGDGIGDFKGLTSRLDYIKSLGVDALWLMPIMKSPFKDSGYDVADYDALLPEYGTDADFQELIAQAHSRKIRIFVDLVYNHTSDLHPWFQESRRGKDDPKADWYVWSDTPSAPGNACGTFNAAQFGESAWQFDEQRKQYYYHRFYPGQPDLNFANPDVVKETLAVTRRWLDKGVDGFRCDVIGLLFESDTRAQCGVLQPRTAEYIRKLRGVLDGYPDRAMVAESVLFESPAGYYGTGKDMFHMAFDFDFGYQWGIVFNSETRASLDRSFAAHKGYPEGAQSALVIGSHDVARAFTVAQGKEWRHRRASEIQLLGRGTPFIYYGEELGLRPGTARVVDGRDSARTPMPWTKKEPGHGFTTGAPWLPFGDQAGTTSVEAETGARGAMLSHYKSLLALRRGRAVFGTGAMDLVDVGNVSVFAFTRSNAQEAWLVAVNLTESQQSGSAELPGTRAELALGKGTGSREGSRVTLDLPPTESVVLRLR